MSAGSVSDAPEEAAPAVFPLSPGQRRLWLADHLEPGPAYNIALALDLCGRLDEAALERAVAELVARHEALRTSIVLVDGEPQQAIWDDTTPPLQRESVDESRLQARLEQLAAQPFDLTAGPPLRMHLLRWASDGVTLAIVLHHILCDGWSVGIMLTELRALYELEIGRGMGPGDPPPFHYADFSEWLREQEDLPADVAHWDERFATPPVDLELRTTDAAVQPSEGGAVQGELPAALMAAVNAFAGTQGTSAFFVLLTAYAVLLARRAAVDDVSIAVPVANRTQLEFERTVGFFVNTIAMRLDVSRNAPLASVLAAIQKRGLADLDHQGYPYEKVLARARALHGERFTELARVMFAYQNAPLTVETWTGLTVTPRPVENGGAKFDLALRVDPLPEGSARTTLEYRATHFAREDAQHLLDGFVALVSALVRTPSCPAALVPLLAPVERAQAIALGSGVGEVAARPGDLCGWFTEAAARESGRVAVRSGDASLTYGELERRSRRLAQRLRAFGVGAEVRVGLACERGLDLVVGMLAIVRAGGAYVPLDPAYPKARLSYIVNDSGLNLVVADDGGRTALDCVDVTIVTFESATESDASLATTTLPSSIDPDQAAYVIYTSGSTGEPKGCLVTHRNVTRLFASCEAWLAPSAEDVWTLFHSYAFDFSVWELWGALLYGGALIVVPHDVARDPVAFLELARSHRVTVLSQTPSAFRQFAAADAEPAQPVPLALRWVVFGGEALEPSSLAAWVARRPHGPRLMNMYGITETTVHVTARELTAADVNAHVPSLVGRALADLQLLVLDEGLEPVPAGTAGELCVGGAGVSRGYLGRASLTASRFVPNPYGAPGSRLYRSGDLGRRRAGGDVEYLGRADQQVKIRGFRIELGEVEAALLAHDGIANAAVQALPGPAGPRLVGYVVSRNGPVDMGALRAWLSAQLPEHFVPAALVPLPRLPLTANGKLDRAALPTPEHALPTNGKLHGEAPHGDVETLLAGIWADVLGLPAGAALGRKDNFFASGGDSIVALRLVAQAKHHGLHISARDVFSNPTIAALAQCAQRAIPPGISHVPEQHEPRLTPIERWFFDLDLAHNSQWSQAVRLRFRDGFGPADVERALHDLFASHPVFGVRFRAGAQGWEALADGGQPRLSVRRYAAETVLPVVAAGLQESLNLGDGPLAAFGWIGDRDGLLIVHHLAIDTASWYVLLEDLIARLEGKALRPPTGGRSAVRAALDARAAGADTAFWRKTLSALRDVPRLPSAQRSAGRYRNAKRRDHVIGGAVLSAFTEALAANAVAEELVLAATLATLSEATGSSHVAVTLERHGRDAIAVDTSRSVGWHTVLAPFVVELPHDAPPERTSGIVAEALCRWTPQAPDYLALRAFAGESDLCELFRDAGLPEVAFNFLGRMALAPEGPVNVLPVPDVRLHDPAGVRPFAHEILGWTDDSGLHLTWLFDGEAAEDATVARWLSRIEAHLERIARSASARVVEFAATPLQAGLIFHTLNESAPGTYLQQVTAELDGDVDPDTMREAWNIALAHHDALTTAFVSRDDGTLAQRLDPSVTPPFQLLDLTSLDARAQDSVLHEHLRADRRKGFAVERAPLMRLTLAQRAQGRWWLLWTHHHAMVDGWSLPVVLDTVTKAYNALLAGRRPALEAVRSYTAYGRWRLAQDERALAAAWRANLEHVDEPCRLRLPLPDVPGEGTEDLTLELPETLVSAVQSFANETGTTTNSVFLAAWALALRLLCGDDRVVLGATLSGRHADVPGIDSMVGLFINTVPVALSVSPGVQAAAWVRTVQDALAAAQDVAHAGLADIQRWVNLPGEALFDTLYVYENYPTIEADSGAFSVRDVEMREHAHYALSLAVVPGSPFRVRLAFDRARIDREGAGGIVECVVALLSGLVQTRQAVGALAPMAASAAERIVEWSRGSEAAQPLTGAALFARAAVATPDAIAIDDGERRVSYAELDGIANALALRLRARGVGQNGCDDVVGICMAKSVGSIAAQLAVWKAGAAFLPLDTAHPVERLALSLRAARASLVLVDETTAAPALGVAPEIVSREIPPVTSAVTAEPFPDALAYVIFTSGSTGEPKGVAVTHRGLANLYEAQRDIAGVSAGERLFAFASPAFDAAIAELLMALARGATLVLPPGGHAAVDYDPAVVLCERRATNVTLPPALLSALDPAALPALTTLLVAGDAASGAQFRAWSSGRRVFNAYGPTEATVCAAMRDCTGIDGEPTLGGPMRGVEMYVLSPDLQPLPPGIPGEIYLGGIGLARGYLHAPRLTAAAFVPSPFATTQGERLYRTGDKGLWTAAGEVRFLGRIDRQVKLRGFRIELAEIEAAVARQPGVTHAVVMVCGEGRAARLVAFVQGLDEEQGARSGSQLRAALARALPHYMVPGAIVWIADWPRTASGKIDRARLLESVPSRNDGAVEAEMSDHSALAGDDPAIRTLSEIWAAVLHAQHVGAHQNFFDLGGDSIAALQIAGRARKHGLALVPRDVLECQTVAVLAERLRDAAPHGEAVWSDVADNEPAPLLPAQRWFHDVIDVAPERFLLSVELELDVAPDIAAFTRAFDAVVVAHESLRLAYDTTTMQPATDVPQLKIIECATSTDRHDLAARLEALKGTIDPVHGPSMMAALVTGATNRFVLAVHHLATDAISMRLILDDLWTAYAQACAGEQVSVPSTRTSVRAYARSLAAAEAEGRFDDEIPYWNRVLEPTHGTVIQALPGPTRQCGTVRHRACEMLDFTPPGAAVEAALLAALLLVFGEDRPPSSLIVEREGHGREGLPDVDLSRTTGWFTAIHPFRLDDTDPEVVKAAIAAIPAGGIGYGALKHLGRRSELASEAACWIAFNYLGRIEGERDAEFRVAADPAGGDQDPRQRRARPLSIEAWIAQGMLVVQWVADERLDVALTDLVPLHAGMALRLLRTGSVQGPGEAALDDDAMAALLDDLSPLEHG